MNASNHASLRQPASSRTRQESTIHAPILWPQPLNTIQEIVAIEPCTESTMQRNHDQLMKAAGVIGKHLVNTAIWNDEGTHCTWLGRRDMHEGKIGPHVQRNAALGPELYSGTAGVALFLDALYKKTGNANFKRVAIAAWERSVHYLKTNPSRASAISFYAGDLGLLYVGYRLGYADRATAKRLAPDLDWLLGKLDRGLAMQHSLDVIGGNAGAIGPLLFLAKRYRVRRCRDIAIQCANEIVNLGTWHGNICVWSTPMMHGGAMSRQPLTGLSQGAAGIGMALLEAYRETGHQTYVTYANGAFAFEEQLFNKDEGNWIDTRYPHYLRDGNVCGIFKGTWSHGAPGIALAHLRAKQLNPARAQFHSERLMTAITTTRKIMQETLQSKAGDATLCNGLLGLSDILLSYALQESPEQVEECQNQMLTYLRGFNSPIDLPSGLVCGGYSPSLMNGLSGIGLHLLRLANSGTIPSVLLLDRETLA
ncbi:MAG TPA: lanthionine synthetase LanC family protein [Burkholderiaceae bacterium]